MFTLCRCSVVFELFILSGSFVAFECLLYLDVLLCVNVYSKRMLCCVLIFFRLYVDVLSCLNVYSIWNGSDVFECLLYVDALLCLNAYPYLDILWC